MVGRTRDVFIPARHERDGNYAHLPFPQGTFQNTRYFGMGATRDKGENAQCDVRSMAKEKMKKKPHSSPPRAIPSTL